MWQFLFISGTHCSILQVQKSRVAFPLANTVPGLALKTRFKIFDLIASHNEIELNNNCLQDSFPGVILIFIVEAQADKSNSAS